MEDKNGFWDSVNEDAADESSNRKGDLPRTGMQEDHGNLEILPIQELRKRAERLQIPDPEKFNKQQLIEEIHKARGEVS